MIWNNIFTKVFFCRKYRTWLLMGEQNKLVKFSRRNNKSSLGGIYIVKKTVKGRVRTDFKRWGKERFDFLVNWNFSYVNLMFPWKLFKLIFWQIRTNFQNILIFDVIYYIKSVTFISVSQINKLRKWVLSQTLFFIRMSDVGNSLIFQQIKRSKFKMLKMYTIRLQINGENLGLWQNFSSSSFGSQKLFTFFLLYSR